MKRFSAGLLAFLLLLLSVMNGGAQAQGTQPKAQVLTLEKAIELAMEKNATIKQVNAQLEKLEIAVEKADDVADQVKDLQRAYNQADSTTRASLDLQAMSAFRGTVVSYQADEAKIIGPAAARAQLEVARARAELAKKQVRLGVTQAFYGALKAQQWVNIMQANLNKVLEQQRITAAKIKAGTAAKVDGAGAAGLVAQARADLSNANVKYKMAVMTLNRLIGNDLETPLTLVGNFKYTPMGKVDINAEVTKVVADNPDIVEVKQDLAVKQQRTQLAKQYYTENVFTVRDFEADQKYAEARVEERELAIRQAVINAWDKMEAAREQINVLAQSRSVMQERLRLATLSYKVGMLTLTELNDVRVSAQKIDELYLDAVYDYLLAKAAFEAHDFSSYMPSGNFLDTGLNSIGSNAAQAQGAFIGGK